MARQSRSERLPGTPAPPAPAQPARPASLPPWLLWVVGGAIAIALRVVLVLSARGVVYPGDLDDFVRWGVQAANDGVLTLYDRPPPRAPMRHWFEGRWIYREREFDRICNYPPGSAYLLYVSGVGLLATTTQWAVNDVPTRLAFGAWSILADVLLAGGCAAIFAALRGGRNARWMYLLLLVLPPFWWDSVCWQQMDTVVLAPLVWMLYCMVRNRWIGAGVLWGIAFSLKPQAILFCPVWGLALFVARPFWRAIAGGAVALLTLGLITLPFTLRDGLLWADKSYRETMFSTYAHFTTLKAFNLWYLYALLTDSVDAKRTLLGISCLGWGKVLMAGSLLAAFVYFARRWRGRAEALVLYSALAMLTVVMLPTQVHERYIVLAIPFLGAAIGVTRRMWASFVVITIVAQVQMAWPLWLGAYPGKFEGTAEALRRSYDEYVARLPSKTNVLPFEEVLRRQRAAYVEERSQTVQAEWVLTLGALAGTALAAITALHVRPSDPPGAPPVSTRATLVGASAAT